ncbi:MAG: STAS domain-containing protein [Puniceicoccales bacterium]
MSKEQFSFSQNNGKVSVVLSTAKFDAQAAETFNEVVREQWRADIHSVTIDMKAVEFIDSSGIGALLALRKRLPADSADVTLVNPQSGITNVLEMLRLHRVFRLEEV